LLSRPEDFELTRDEQDEADRYIADLRGVTSGEERRTLLAMGEARRAQADGLMWSLPALSLTAQAFLLTITLRSDIPDVGRVVSAFAGLVFAFGAFRGMLEHRRNEELLSRWLDYCETTWQLPPLHRFSSVRLVARSTRGAPEHSSRWLRPPFLPAPRRGFKAFRLWAGVLLVALGLDLVLLVFAVLDWMELTNVFRAGQM
jgi:hypothetical protein